jgi:sulfite reductase beta subunit-like hemoprotein
MSRKKIQWHWVRYNNVKQLMTGSEIALLQQSGGHVKIIRHAHFDETPENKLSERKPNEIK